MDVETQSERPGWVDRVGALSGPAYVVLVMTGNSIAEPGEPAHATGAQVLAQLEEQAGSTAAQIGSSMEILGFVGLAFFVGWLATVLRRHADRAPWLATAVVVGGAATLAVKIGSVFPELALKVNRGSVDQSTARLVNDMGSAGFVLSFLTFGIFMLATGLAVLDSGIAGRVAGWSAVVIGALGIIATVATQADPLATSALPFLLGLLWILVLGVRFALRGPSHSVTHAVATPRAAHV